MKKLTCFLVIFYLFGCGAENQDIKKQQVIEHYENGSPKVGVLVADWKAPNGILLKAETKVENSVEEVKEEKPDEDKVTEKL